MFEEKKIQSEEEREDLHTNDSTTRWVSPREVRLHGTNPTQVRSRNGFSSQLQGRLGSSSSSTGSSSSGLEPQDADYSYSYYHSKPQLIDELEALILARVPRSEYGKFCLVNKRFLSLVKSGEIVKIRKEIGFKEPTVFMLASPDEKWWAYDRQFNSLRVRELPILPADDPFKNGDKETLCVGTHLLVSGKEKDGSTVWRYNLVTNRWLKGPSMIDSRCLFAAATCGTFGYVAGGLEIGIGFNRNFLSTAERYNSETETWEPLPSMHRSRASSAGFYMDNRFYVVGGRNDEDGDLTFAEAFDEKRKEWDLIPNMLDDMPVLDVRSPPLVAVVNNELYSLEASTNQLKVYLKQSNSWKRLGTVPVKADSMGGWGVAFKSLGDELLVIGRPADADHGPIYACRPDPKAAFNELNWRPLEGGINWRNPFIRNCSVMLA